jgi:hypothetical protein
MAYPLVLSLDFFIGNDVAVDIPRYALIAIFERE